MLLLPFHHGHRISHPVSAAVLSVTMGDYFHHTKAPLGESLFNELVQHAGMIYRTPTHKNSPGGHGKFGDVEGVLDVAVRCGSGLHAVGGGR